MRRHALRALPWLGQALLMFMPAPGVARTDQVWLRIRNASQEAFSHAWQGLPQRGTDVDLGPLLPGETSRWHALPPVLAHYRKTRIVIGQRQLTHVTDTSFPAGQTTLVPGRYTFVYTVSEGTLHLTVIREAEAVP